MYPFEESFTIQDGVPKWHGRPVPGVDAATFRALGGNWAVDDQKVFVQCSHRKSIDRKSFEFLNPVFVKDARAVYDWSKPIAGADPATFEVLDPGFVPGDDIVAKPTYQSYARDKNAVYFHDQMFGKACVLRGADRDTFRSFRNGFGADHQQVWSLNYRLKGAHAPSWVYLGGGYSIDREKVFYLDRPLPGVVREKFCVILHPGVRLATDGTQFFSNDSPISRKEFIEDCLGEFAISPKWVENELKERCGLAFTAKTKN